MGTNPAAQHPYLIIAVLLALLAAFVIVLYFVAALEAQAC
jgi:hypothetical protein